MNFLKELKAKPKIQRQAFFVRANQIVRNAMQKKMPDEEWEKMERDEKYPIEITQRKGDEDVNIRSIKSARKDVDA